MRTGEPRFTFGIEEEYHLVDLESRDLAPAPPELMAACEAALGGQVSPEFLRSQIEVGTRVMTSFGEARAELGTLRTTIAELAGAHGLAPLAAGTHPFGRGDVIPPTDRDRYRALVDDLQHVVRRLATCGMHVHVGLADDDLRIDIMNQMRYFVPHLLALSTSSPFWQGDNTGLKCYRLSVLDELPRTGLPGRFSSWAEYAGTIDVLVRARVIENASKVWWDIRPSARFQTLELRVADSCTRLEDALAVAAVFVCLCRMLYRLRRNNQSWRTYPLFLLEENRWRAQRYGAKATLFDFGKGELVPMADLAEEIIAITAEDAAALGCEAEVARIRTIVAEGTSADRQVACFDAAQAAGKAPAAALQAVVDMLVGETREKL